MANVTLEAYNILKLNFSIMTFEPVERFELSNTLSTNVNYDEINHKCNCKYMFSIKSKEPKVDFNVEIEIIGAFSYDEKMDKKVVHVEAARILYPYLQSTTSSLFSMIGMPNFVLPAFALTTDDITNNDNSNGTEKKIK